MSLIDPNLFKAEPEVSDGRPFAPAGAAEAAPDLSAFRDPRPLTRWVSGFVWVDTAFLAAFTVMMAAQALGLAEILPLEETLDPTVGQMIFSLTAMVYLGFIVLRIPPRPACSPVSTDRRSSSVMPLGGVGWSVMGRILRPFRGDAVTMNVARGTGRHSGYPRPSGLRPTGGVGWIRSSSTRLAGRGANRR